MTKLFRKAVLPTYLVVFPLVVALVFVLGLLVVSDRSPARAEATNTAPPEKAVRTLESTSQAFAELAAAVKPAVVNISTTKTMKRSDRRNSMEPFFQDPFFRHYFGGDPRDFAPREHKQRSLGSGVLIDADGVIVTNNHVVEGADEISVRLGDGREFKGSVKGTDPKSDLAVVKIDARDLPFLQMGDSSSLDVGHLVMAVGNPFGLNQTVTTGIVSAKGRVNVGIADYEDFIQTDAAINPGNSGGAMVNARGELVGVNTAIFSTTGGYQGIGFAVPTTIVKPVVESLLAHGKVVRGWLGVMIQPVTPELARQFSLDEAKGALVSDVVNGSPAEKAGLKRGDVIVAYEGQTVEDPGHLRNRVAATAPETKTGFTIVRDGKTKTVSVTLGELPGDMQGTSPVDEDAAGTLFDGVAVDELTPPMRKQLDIPVDLAGVVVKAIRNGAAAEDVLKPGDVILEINRTPTDTIEGFRKAAGSLGKDDTALVLLYRNGATLFFTLSDNS